MARRAVVSIMVTGLVLVGCTDDDPVVPEPTASTTPTDEPTSPTPTASPSAPSEEPDPTPRDVPVSAELSGVTAVPGPGDPTGTGTFTGTITTGENSGELCYELTVADLTSEVVAAHVHAGAAGTSGDVLVALEAPTEGSAEGCVTLNAADVLDVLDNPAGYYVNVHSRDHPDGAVRGQLARG